MAEKLTPTNALELYLATIVKQLDKLQETLDNHILEEATQNEEIIEKLNNVELPGSGFSIDSF